MSDAQRPITVIDDVNFERFLRSERNPLRDLQPGALPRTTRVGELPCAPAGRVKLIPENEWVDRIHAMDAAKAWAQDAYDRVNPVHQYQNGLPYCWAFSLAQCVEIARAVTRQPYVQLGPESLGRAVGWRNVGNSLDSSIRCAAEYGIASRAFIQEHSRIASRYQEGWEADALNHRVEEWLDLGYHDVWAETVSVLLTGLPVYVGLRWWMHVVCYTKLVIVGGEICPYTPNTHAPTADVVLKGNRKIPDLGCFSPNVETFSFQGGAI